MSSVATSAGSPHEAAHPQAPLPFSTLDGLVPTKTVLLTADPAAADPVAAKREEILAYFHRTCELDDRLFDLIRNEAAFFVRHEPLRHPPIFYLAHPATFYVNKLYVARQADLDVLSEQWTAALGGEARAVQLVVDLTVSNRKKWDQAQAWAERRGNTSRVWQRARAQLVLDLAHGRRSSRVLQRRVALHAPMR
jgi:hypothetical protein